MKISGIYQIKSRIKPEQIYIGSAVNIQKRWLVHLCELRSNKHKNKKLQNHYNKYGESDFVFSIIELCLPEFLTIKENTYFNPLPYFNICPIAGSSLKFEHSKESKIKMSKSAMGRIGWNKDKIFSLETRKKMSEKRKGIKFSEERKQNMRKPKSEDGKKNISMGLVGNKYRLGKSFPGKKIINTLTDEIFDSIKSAAIISGMKYRTFHAQITGENLNRTNFRLIA